MNEAAAKPIEGPLVLVIEDEEPVRRFLDASLGAHGYRVVAAESGEAALRLAAQYVPDIVLLDLGLPDVDGTQVIRALRAWSSTPIVVLSARGHERSKVDALDQGADDYLTKPFGVPELLARMRVALRHAARRGSAASGGTFRCGPLRVELEQRRVFAGDEEVHLTPTEFKLLAVLVQHAGKVVTHGQLLREVWGPRSTEQTQYLRVYMTHLRRKLERGVAPARVFATEAGVGYRLECPEPPAP